MPEDAEPAPPTTTLYRPVDQKELDLIRAAGLAAFPPRLDWQSIFYPVTTEEYANRIAREWNTRDAASGYAGYVIRFRVRSDFLDRYEPHIAGRVACQEYWIPAADLVEFDRNIVGKIEVIAEFQGELPGHTPPAG